MFKNFMAALGVLGTVGGGLYVVIDAVRTVYVVEAQAGQALANSQKALERTEGIDVIQKNQEQFQKEIDEIQKHLVVLKEEQERKLDKILEAVKK